MFKKKTKDITTPETNVTAPETNVTAPETAVGNINTSSIDRDLSTLKFK